MQRENQESFSQKRTLAIKRFDLHSRGSLHPVIQEKNAVTFVYTKEKEREGKEREKGENKELSFTRNREPFGGENITDRP